MVGSKPTPPTGGPTETPPTGVKAKADSPSYMEQALASLMVHVERAILAKASSYTDAKHMIDAQRSDRAALLSKLHIALSERVEGAEDHPVEGLYLSETDLVLRYREKLRAGGLFLLPTVVEVIPADASGNIGVIVEFAVADTEGRLWPAAVRVTGVGNDRIARGLNGPLAMPRAMSSAWKEAVTRIAFIGRGYDVEKHVVPPDAPASRPSNSKAREPALSLADEDDFRKRVIAKLEEAESLSQIDALLGHKRTVELLAKVSSRTRKAIEDVEREMRRRCDYGRRDDRGGSRRESEGRPDAEVRDAEDQRQYNDPDDDIPF